MSDPLFVCPICKRQSWHPRDAEQRFCAKCGFVDDVLAEWKIRALMLVGENDASAHLAKDDKPAPGTSDG